MINVATLNKLNLVLKQVVWLDDDHFFKISVFDISFVVFIGFTSTPLDK